MPKAFAAIVIDPEGNPQSVAGEIPDSEWAALCAFAEFEDELSRTDYVAARMPLEAQVSRTQDHGWEEPRLPPDATIREFLMMLRPFLLEKEPTEFYRVLNIVGRRYDNSALRNNLKTLRAEYSGEHLQKYCTVSLGDLVLNSDAGVKLWLNAFEYHRDVDKRKLLGDAAENVPLSVLKVLFIEVLRRKVEAIEWLAMFIRCAAQTPNHPHTIDLRPR